MKLRWWLLCTFACLCSHALLVRAQAPPDPHRRFHALGDFRLENGVLLPNAKIAYATFGTLNPERNNAILLPSWYGSNHHGYDFLLGPGRALRRRLAIESGYAQTSLPNGKSVLATSECSIVFYDVDQENKLVKIEAVGYKKGSQLFIRDREYKL